MRIFRQLVANGRVIVTTCIGSGHSLFDGHLFDRVIIDECAHCLEPGSLIPLTRGCNKLVLVGDDEQLSAVVLSREALERGLNISLMERLSLSHVTDVHFLDVQRRMHPSILEFPNQHFYKGRIQSEDVTDETRGAISGFMFPNPAIRVCLIEVTPASNSATDLETNLLSDPKNKRASGSKLNKT